MKLIVVTFFLILSFSNIYQGVAQENLDTKSAENAIDKRIVEVYGEYISELIKEPLILKTITEIVQKELKLYMSLFEIMRNMKNCLIILFIMNIILV
jgi:hypothetical protein